MICNIYIVTDGEDLHSLKQNIISMHAKVRGLRLNVFLTTYLAITIKAIHT